jgi:predicted PurR-regulated permease PerM
LPFDSRARTLARVAIAILVVLLAAWVARDFLVALTWAAVIAIAVWPIYIRSRFPSLAAVRRHWRRCCLHC